MNVLCLSREQAQTIIAHAQDAMPHESCGLIAGRGTRTLEIIPISNVAATPQNTYVMDPAALAQHLPAIDQAGLTLIGLYHSHPSGEPLPSQTDIREATFQHTPYVIVGLSKRQPEIAAWQFNGPRVQRVELYIGDHPPVKLDSNLSAAQQIAIGISAIIAVCALLAAAYYLLPPAPPIP